MSETENTTPAGNAEPAKKKGGSKMLIIIILAVVLLGGGGGGFYYWRTSAAAAAAEGETDKPKSKKGADTADKGKGSKKSSKSAAEDEAQDDSAVKKIIELQPFIVNLADTEQARYLRLTVTLGIGGEGGGGESEKPDQLFITRVRNAMLAVLSDKKSDEILSIEGKAKLRKELLKAAKSASEEPAVEAIYITDFIVQL